MQTFSRANRDLYILFGQVSLRVFCPFLTFLPLPECLTGNQINTSEAQSSSALSRPVLY